ncbi:MAG: hypothetical protein SGJ05_12090 [bacterium]|nr:hypothetical protein [bacterium]
MTVMFTGGINKPEQSDAQGPGLCAKDTDTEAVTNTVVQSTTRINRIPTS